MRVSVTREETVERTWECARCRARGHVHLRAIGDSGWRQVWWSRDEAEAEAADDARWAVQHDAERMLGMIRCPSCHRRAPRVWMWAALRCLFPVVVALLFTATLAAVALGVWDWPGWVAPLIVFGGIAVALLPERRRWIEAGKTTVRDLRAGDPAHPVLPKAVVRALPAKAAAPPPDARARQAGAGPRSQRWAPARLAPVTSAAPAAVERPDDADGPRFLRSGDGD